MDKIKKNFRLTQEVVNELQEISEVLGVSETEVVSRAIHVFFLQMKSEENGTISGSLVPLSEYQKIHDQLKQALYRLGELEGKLSEKEERLKEKDELITELRNHISDIKTKSSKHWWEFWK